LLNANACASNLGSLHAVATNDKPTEAVYQTHGHGDVPVTCHAAGGGHAAAQGVIAIHPSVARAAPM
jgi:hypothetical protein